MLEAMAAESEAPRDELVKLVAVALTGCDCPGCEYEAAVAVAAMEPVISAARAEAWDEGHHTPWLRDEERHRLCNCGAYCEDECGCGNYGAKKPAPNPYRTGESL